MGVYSGVGKTHLMLETMHYIDVSYQFQSKCLLEILQGHKMQIMLIDVKNNLIMAYCRSWMMISKYCFQIHKIKQIVFYFQNVLLYRKLQYYIKPKYEVDILEVG